MQFGCFLAAIFFAGMCVAEIRRATAVLIWCGRVRGVRLAGIMLWAAFFVVALYCAFAPG